MHPARLTLADLPVGRSGTLASGSDGVASGGRLAELGLRPGARIQVLMRTTGGGRVVGIGLIRLALDRVTLGALALEAPSGRGAMAP